MAYHKYTTKMWSLCTVVHYTIMNILIYSFAVKINIAGPLKMIASQDVSIASTLKTAATSFRDITHVVVLSIVSI